MASQADLSASMLRVSSRPMLFAAFIKSSTCVRSDERASRKRPSARPCEQGEKKNTRRSQDMTRYERERSAVLPTYNVGRVAGDGGVGCADEGDQS